MSMHKHGCLEASLKRRVPKEYLGSFKAGHRHAAKEYIDEEFSLELLKQVEQGCEKAREALEWLTRFNNQFYRGFDGPEPKELRRARYKRDNDTMAKSRVDFSILEASGENQEDLLIAILDLKFEKEKSKPQ